MYLPMKFDKIASVDHYQNNGALPSRKSGMVTIDLSDGLYFSKTKTNSQKGMVSGTSVSGNEAGWVIGKKPTLTMARSTETNKWSTIGG